MVTEDRRPFLDDDYLAYTDLMSQWCQANNVDIWGYCLMPNHVHLIAIPAAKDGLRLAIGEAHRRYTGESIFERTGVGICGRGGLLPM